MALILHLSDVHLGNITDSQVLGDFKSDIVPLAERPNRIQAIEESLTQLGRQLAAKHGVLDAVVLTGDITVAGSEEGFKQMTSLLNRLGPALPKPERI